MGNTPRHLKDRVPRYVLVVWGWDGEDVDIPRGSIGCVGLADVSEAESHGAIALCFEDAEFCKPRQPQRVDPFLIQMMKLHPYRYNANRRPDEEDWR